MIQYPVSLLRGSLTKGRDYTELFETIYSVAEDIGLDKSLEYLEKCVIDKKMMWLEENLNKIKRDKSPIDNALKILYELYLKISFGRNGIIVKKTDKELVTRCWNRCPVLEACQKFNLDTKIVCRQSYDRWIQIFLSKIHPKLKFYRNYERIRPYSPYCEEVIVLDD